MQAARRIAGVDLSMIIDAGVAAAGAIWAVIALQYAITGHPPQGLEWFVPFAAAYSLGAHTTLRANCTTSSLIISA